MNEKATYLQEILTKNEKIKYIPSLHWIYAVLTIWTSIPIFYSILLYALKTKGVIEFINSIMNAEWGELLKEIIPWLTNSKGIEYTLKMIDIMEIAKNPSKLYPTIAIILVIILGIAVYIWLKVTKTEYLVTDKRIISKQGIIAIATRELRNQKLIGISMHQGIIERIFNCGTLTFHGIGGTKVTFHHMENPKQAKILIENICEQMR
jgi:uncharacterized membrane protein YdbT with pleckstrin-like domain